MTGTYCIVVAWTNRATVPVDWESTRIDMGELPRFEVVVEPAAAVWLLEGTRHDFADAGRHIASLPGGRVFVYPVGEPDPLGRAKADVLAHSSGQLLQREHTKE